MARIKGGTSGLSSPVLADDSWVRGFRVFESE
jgi:hypothetical protein